MGRYPEAYVEFLAHFHATRDFFECHELLEEYWKEETSPERKGLWHGLIQVAVGLYHERRGNLKGAKQMLSSAIQRLSQTDTKPSGLQTDLLLKQLQARIDKLSAPYEDLDLPISDSELEGLAKTKAEQWGVIWGRSSPMSNEELIHRHTRRDRTEVIEERERRIKERGKEQGL